VQISQNYEGAMRRQQNLWIRHVWQEIFADPFKRLQFALLVLLFLNLFGTFMYMALEKWTFVEAWYMTVITIATVGFGEVRELSPAGRIFTIILIYVGVGAATAAVGNAISLTMGPLLWGSLRRKRMLAMIEKLDQHYIVCGYGRMGQQIIRDLQARDEAFVLIDMNSEIHQRLTATGLPYIIGDATDDDVLFSAGLKRAKGLVAALNNDAANIMTVLTARELNPGLFIVARVVRQESESKLRRAGANRVINPYQIGGHRIALSLLRPAVHDFLDQIFRFSDEGETDIGQIHIRPNSEIVGKTLARSNLRNTHQVNILAIRDPGGKISISPGPDVVIQPNSELIVIGPAEAIYQLERETLK